MTTVISTQPATDTIAPVDQAGVADAVRAASRAVYGEGASRAVYPLGGCTALDYGTTATTSATHARLGIGIDLTGLSRIVDYTPRDMTILVEAGVRMADLTATLAAEGQQLPIDVPRAGEATIGGVVATNWNGPRRYGYGTIRDYVIGIHAVDGRGVAFKGGGRVVKNVAGYDFCKLLIGSLGTLAVITQVALKLKPLPEHSAAIVAAIDDFAAAEAILKRLAQLEAPPVAIDVLVGSDWTYCLQNCGLGDSTRNPPSAAGNCLVIVVRVEGTEPEVAWLLTRLEGEFRTGGAANSQRLTTDAAAALWDRQVEFSDRGAGDTADRSPLVLKIAVPPSATMATVAEIIEIDPHCAIQAHAGSGVVYVRFARFDESDVTRTLVGRLRPAAVRRGGSLVVVSTSLTGLTPHVVWGGRSEATVLLEQIKRAFDPQNILSPGRFVY